MKYLGDIKTGINEWLDGYVPTYFVTLNSKIVCRTKSNDFEMKSGTVDRKVRVLIPWMRQYMYGKQCQDYLRAVSFYEVGKHKNVLHSHVVVSVNKESDRSLNNLQVFVDRRWEKLRSHNEERATKSTVPVRFHKILRWIDHSRNNGMFAWETSGNTDIRLIDHFEGLVRYSSKDFRFNMAEHQFCAFNLH